MLTAVLVLAMGMLGGTVTMTRVYLDGNRKLPFSYYVFVPLLGAITGFAVYVLAKAGVLIIADGGSGQEGAYLSPFFVSFLGLMSGMLSEDALETILMLGRRMFDAAGDNVPRWFVGDPEKYGQDSDLIKDIANVVEASEDKVKLWLSGKVVVPPATQILIAAKIGPEQRVLFTDLPPATVKKDAEKPSADPDIDKTNVRDGVDADDIDTGPAKEEITPS